MPKVCSLSGKKVQYGNNVSHANNRTKRRFLPNLQNVSFLSDILGIRVRAKLATSTLRSVEKQGGIDSYLLNTTENMLSKKFRKLKKTIASKAA